MSETELISILRQAAAHLNHGQFDKAMESYRAALAIDAGNAGAMMGQVLVFMRTQHFSQAVQILERLLIAAKQSRKKGAKEFEANVLAHLGLCHEHTGQYGPAMKYYMDAAKKIQNNEIKLKILRLASIVKNPEPVQQLLSSAEQLIRGGQMESAVKMYNASLQLYPDCVEAMVGLGNFQRARGNADLALPLLQRALVLAPDRTDIYNDIGVVFQAKGDIQKAVSFHKRALKQDADYIFALINLGVAYKRLGKVKDAIDSYSKALRLSPHLPEVHNNIGNLYRISGDFEKAEFHLNEALKLRPDYEDAKVNLASLAADMKASSQTTQPARKAKSTKKSVENVSEEGTVVDDGVAAGSVQPARSRTSKTGSTQPQQPLKPLKESSKRPVVAMDQPVSKVVQKAPAVRKSSKAGAAATSTRGSKSEKTSK